MLDGSFDTQLWYRVICWSVVTAVVMLGACAKAPRARMKPENQSFIWMLMLHAVRGVGAQRGEGSGPCIAWKRIRWREEGESGEKCLVVAADRYVAQGGIGPDEIRTLEHGSYAGITQRKRAGTGWTAAGNFRGGREVDIG